MTSALQLLYNEESGSVGTLPVDEVRKEAGADPLPAREEEEKHGIAG